MNKITDKTTNKTMDKTTNKIANQITMLGTGNATISQINTDFLFGYLGGILLPIMARMNLCKSVVSVGLLKRLTFSAFFNTLLPALFLPA